MTENILYKKTYEKNEDLELDEPFITESQKALTDVKNHIDGFKEKRIYVKIPEKDAIMRPFVQGAINFSNDLSVDIEIVQRDDRITVCFSFEDVEVFTELKEVIALSDEIIIDRDLRTNKLIFELHFITHIMTSKNG